MRRKFLFLGLGIAVAVAGAVQLHTFVVNKAQATGCVYQKLINPTTQFTVPANCTRMKVKLWGDGGNSWNVVSPNQFPADPRLTAAGGGGGFTYAVLNVTPGQQFIVDRQTHSAGGGVGGYGTGLVAYPIDNIVPYDGTWMVAGGGGGGGVSGSVTGVVGAGGGGGGSQGSPGGNGNGGNGGTGATQTSSGSGGSGIGCGGSAGNDNSTSPGYGSGHCGGGSGGRSSWIPTNGLLIGGGAGGGTPVGATSWGILGGGGGGGGVSYLRPSSFDIVANFTRRATNHQAANNSDPAYISTWGNGGWGGTNVTGAQSTGQYGEAVIVFGGGASDPDMDDVTTAESKYPPSYDQFGTNATLLCAHPREKQWGTPQTWPYPGTVPVSCTGTTVTCRLPTAGNANGFVCRYQCTADPDDAYVFRQPCS